VLAALEVAEKEAERECDEARAEVGRRDTEWATALKMHPCPATPEQGGAVMDSLALRAKDERAEVSRSHAAILALTGEVERLRADLEIAEPQKSAAVNALAARADKAEAERDEAEAEVERLREALKVYATEVK
jgi:hypothetical protein